MAGRWKRRLEQMGRANRETREHELRTLTLQRAARILEGLLLNPVRPPRRRRRHPVSLSRRMRRRYV